MGVGRGEYYQKKYGFAWEVWRFHLEIDSLWHMVIESKYGFHSNGWDVGFGISGTLRALWKSISRVSI
ncbi:hypothetical protein LguiB_013353 [Lonicera macranthoides]